MVGYITQKLLEEKKTQPKLQVLIYPWVQMVNYKLPSFKRYTNYSFLSNMGLEFGKVVSWYLGISEKSVEYSEFTKSLENNDLFNLIEDKELLKKYKSYFDTSKIPDRYKIEKSSFYEDYEKSKDLIFPSNKLDSSNILLKDSNLNQLAKKLFSREVSPLLADKKYLIGLPKAYFVVFEWDELKDEGLLYAERLKEANVDVTVAFYENAFHGMASLTEKLIGFEFARKIQTDLIEFLKGELM